jgi:hypothetical protein
MSGGTGGHYASQTICWQMEDSTRVHIIVFLRTRIVLHIPHLCLMIGYLRARRMSFDRSFREGRYSMGTAKRGWVTRGGAGCGVSGLRVAGVARSVSWIGERDGALGDGPSPMDNGPPGAIANQIRAMGSWGESSAADEDQDDVLGHRRKAADHHEAAGYRLSLVQPFAFSAQLPFPGASAA